MIQNMKLNSSYNILHKLGYGAYSNVFLGIHRFSGMKVAIKIIQKNTDENIQENKYLDILRETKIFQSLNHPNIVKLFEFFEDEKNFYFVEEFCEHGTVAQYIHNFGFSEGPDCKLIFLQLINAISYLHNYAGILHCDIKAENVLLDNNNNVKLTDFGLAYSHKDDNNNNIFTDSNFYTKIKGTPAYIAPEILEGGSNSIQSDIWSIGVFLYYIVTGSLPFEDDLELDGLIHTIIKMKPYYPSYLSTDVIQLLTKLLKKNPNERINLEQIKNSSWCKDMSDSFDDLDWYFKYDKKNIDNEIIQQIIKTNPTLFGSFENFVEDIKEDKFNEKTTFYKILLKKKENEIFNNNLKNVKKKFVGHRSSDIKIAPQFYSRKRKSNSFNLKKVTINSKGNVPKMFDPIKFLE